MENEEWRVIAEAPDYEVSDRGRVRRCTPDWQGKYLGRILKPSLSRGYHRYLLCVGGRHINRTAHSLVCIAFNGPKPSPEMHCAHKDGDRLNNTPENLYWATPLENAADRDRHGRTHRGPRRPEAIARLPRGDRHYSKIKPEAVARGDNHYARKNPEKVKRGEDRYNSKLTEEQARAIKFAPRGFGTGKKLAEQFGVTMGLVCAIRNGRVWTHLR